MTFAVACQGLRQGYIQTVDVGMTEEELQCGSSIKL